MISIYAFMEMKIALLRFRYEPPGVIKMGATFTKYLRHAGLRRIPTTKLTNTKMLKVKSKYREKALERDEMRESKLGLEYFSASKGFGDV